MTQNKDELVDTKAIKKSYSRSSGDRIMAVVDAYYLHWKEAFIERSWPTLLHFAKSTTLAIMNKIDYGRLEVLTKDHVYEFGQRGAKESAKIKVISDRFWIRLLLLGDLGFAESYMYGEVVCNDLSTLIKVFINNRRHVDDMTTAPSCILKTINRIMNSRFANTITNAINNISAHYDISNEMFASFLSGDMTYSSAVFVSQDDTLEEAQLRKLRMIISKARISADDHVLEIGSGWGSFAIEAVKSTGCRVTTLTLSIEQKVLAEQRIAMAGLSDRIEVLLCDYRKLEVEQRFDKIVSIEMIEAVGPEYLVEYFECVNRFLKEKDGIAVFQVITMPETRYARYCREVDFIRKYIFPGGHCPTVTSLIAAINKGSRGCLIVDDIENIGPHYARTLRLWRERFIAVFDERIACALEKEHPEMTPNDVEIFRRKWEFYFAYCESGFMNRILGNVQVVITREQNLTFLEGIPL